MCRDVWTSVFLMFCALLLCGAVPVTKEADYLDREEVQAELDSIKQRLLINLGLSRVPDVSRANVSEAEMARMKDIYRRSVAESREAEDEEEEEDERSIHRFYSYRDNAPVNRTSSWQHLNFPLRISNQQSQRHFTLHSAKLRIRRPCRGQSGTASLYQLLEPWNGSESADRLLVEERKLRPKLTSRSRRRSEDVFDLSRPASTWLESPALNYGLLLQCSSSLQARHSNPRAVLDLVVKERPTRQKRSKTIDGRHIQMECSSSNKTSLCCRYSLTVSFKEIGWDFIVEPKQFQANFCRGKCPRSMSHTFATNHAIIQSLASYYEKNVPRPCCVPKKLRALEILHYSDKSPELVVTRKKGMIVKSCGCS